MILALVVLAVVILAFVFEIYRHEAQYYVAACPGSTLNGAFDAPELGCVGPGAAVGTGIAGAPHVQLHTDGRASHVRLSSRYMWVGIFAGLLAPAGLLFHGVINDNVLDPMRLFLVLAFASTVTFAVIGRMVGRRDEALLARNRELLALSARLKELSTLDGLTGIPNRRTFDERLASEVARSARYGQPCALVMIDLDRFKAVNDGYGHPAGDEILKHVAALFAGEKRTGDLVARYGGEEFAAILPHVNEEAAAAWSERVRAHLDAETLRWRGADITITASFGVAALSAQAQTAEALVDAADRAVYEAKARGGNQVVVDGCLRGEERAVFSVRSV